MEQPEPGSWWDMKGDNSGWGYYVIGPHPFHPDWVIYVGSSAHLGVYTNPLDRFYELHTPREQ